MMLCPYCGKEMEQGLIQSQHKLLWQKGEEREMLFNLDFARESVTLSKYSFWRGSAVVAFLCRECQKVVIDYGNASSDLNAK